MTVTTVTAQGTPTPTATMTIEGISYEVTYLVETDNHLDGPQVVLSSPLLPAIYSPYTFGNDSDPHSVLQSLSPKRIDPRKWLVTCNYLPINTKAPDGQAVTNPLDEQPQVEVTFQQFVRPVNIAEFKRIGVGLSGAAEEPDEFAVLLRTLGPRDAPVYVRGDTGRPRNSAGDLIDPPLEMDDSRMLIRITRNEAENDPDLREYVNAVNTDVVTIRSRGLNWKFKPAELKMQNIQSTAHDITIPFAEYTESEGHGTISRVFRRFTYWQISYELAVKMDRVFGESGWYHVVLDAGYNVRTVPGELDGNFGVIAAAQVFPQNEKVPLSQAATDVRGFTYSTPQPLNGHGKLLETRVGAGRPQTEQGIAIVYGAYHGLPFSLLNL